MGMFCYFQPSFDYDVGWEIVALMEVWNTLSFGSYFQGGKFTMTCEKQSATVGIGVSYVLDQSRTS